MSFDCVKLKKWFRQHQRELPWRDNPSPYAVWVSEVMLQQTQVAVVIPYFERWMQRYPNIETLAKAPLEDVIKSWEGLGYYSRARNLHQGSQYVLEHHAGILPDTAEDLRKIKGLGEYTVGAILSFAFHKRVAAVDGNVMRVLTRYFKIEEDICKPKSQRNLREIALSILPEEESWIVNEALIELGATVCTKKAHCQICPLRASCAAFKEGVVDLLPIKTNKTQIEHLHRAVAVLLSGSNVLIRRVGKEEIMADLHEFPHMDIGLKEIAWKKLQTNLKQMGLTSTLVQTLPDVRQSFTRYQVKLYPFIARCSDDINVEGYMWVPLNTLIELPFSSGHRKILNLLNALDPLLVHH